MLFLSGCSLPVYSGLAQKPKSLQPSRPLWPISVGCHRSWGGLRKDRRLNEKMALLPLFVCSAENQAVLHIILGPFGRPKTISIKSAKPLADIFSRAGPTSILEMVSPSVKTLSSPIRLKETGASLPIQGTKSEIEPLHSCPKSRFSERILTDNRKNLKNSGLFEQFSCIFPLTKRPFYIKHRRTETHAFLQVSWTRQ